MMEGHSAEGFSAAEDKCEFWYRMGRVCDGLGRANEAIGAYESAYQQGRDLREYFAARAALQSGYICEKRGDKQAAVVWFEKCISLKDHDYKNSLDQKAKAGIARCKGE